MAFFDYQRRELAAVVNAPATSARSGPPLEELESPELLRLLESDPDSEEAHLVYGDWLQARGDPRGELIALQHQLQATPDHVDLAYAEALLLRQLTERMFAGLPGEGTPFTLEWRLGFVAGARLAGVHGWSSQLPAALFLERLLAHPFARLLQELRLGLVGDALSHRHTPGDLLRAMVKAGLRANLRRIFLGDFDPGEDTEMSSTDLGDLHELWPLYPGLRELILQAGRMELGRLELPELRSVELRTGGLSRASARAVTSARWPKLERLLLWTGDRHYGCEVTLDDLRPLWGGSAPAPLRELGILDCDFADDVCTALAGSPLAARLEVLDLSLGTLSDEGATILIDAHEAFPRLRRLRVDQSYLTGRTLPHLERHYPELVAGEQRHAAEDHEGNLYRYVSVGE